VILGREPGTLAGWSEDVENRFSLWAENPSICDDTAPYVRRAAGRG